MRYATRAIQNNLCTENTSIKVKEAQNGSGCEELSVEENINDIIINMIYYKRRSLYLCSAKAPLLPGSVSRRVYRRKGTSLDRVYVCL